MTVIDYLVQYAYQRRREDEEPFKLASGGTSFEYLDCRAALSHPRVLSVVCSQMNARLVGDIEAIGGLTMGADPLAVGMSIGAFDARWFSVRKQAKAHGKGKLIEGAVTPGMRVCVVDDVATTGGSTIQAIQACHEFSLDVRQVIVLVDREAGGLDNIRQHVPATTWVSALVTKSEIADAYTRTHP
jgi:orotate phosphoribosyltransferase